MKIVPGTEVGRDACGRWAWMVFDGAGGLIASGWDLPSMECARLAAAAARSRYRHSPEYRAAA